jgi:hypothetical protein
LGPVVGGVVALIGLVGLVVSGTVTGTEVEPCSPNVVVVVASVVVVDSLHIGWVVVVGPVVSGTVTGTEVETSPPRVVVVVDSMQGGCVVVVGASVVVVGASVVVDPCSPRVVVVDSVQGGGVVVVDPCSPIVVVVDSVQGGGVVVVVDPCSPRVVVVGGSVVVVVVVVVLSVVVVWQSVIRSTDVWSSYVTPSGQVECTCSVMVPVVPPGTVVVACVVSPSAIVGV